VRIISGSNRGRRINPPQNLPVRPTTDFAKESLFNILNNRVDFEEINVLDLFAGTGNISYEFASRGALSIKAVDIDNKCIDFVNKIATDLKFSNLKGIKANVFKYLENSIETFDLIFADPPYDINESSSIPDLIFENKLLKENGIFVMEHSRNLSFVDHENFVEHRKYGNVNFTFFGE
jgi:16S rRNA (guanine966-N2)-methyltransferase